MSSKQLYVIFRGCYIDWYIPVKDRNDGLGWKLFIKNWAPRFSVDVTTELVAKSNKEIKKFPKNSFNDMIKYLKQRIR